MDNLNHHLSRSQAVHHIGSYSTSFHGLDELLHHLEAYVSLQKGHLYFLQGCLYICLGETAFAPQALEYILQFIG